jgi:hypothetical protein
LLTIESSLESQKPSTWKILIPGIVAATSAYALFYVLTGYVFGDLYDFPEYDGVQVIQLIYALFLGLLGGALGLLFINLYKVMKRVSEPLQSRPIPLALLTGLILGMVGVLLPLTLFDGQEQIQDLIDNAAELGIIMLIILALAKIFLTVTCLSMGWLCLPILLHRCLRWLGGASGLPIHTGGRLHGLRDRWHRSGVVAVPHRPFDDNRCHVRVRSHTGDSHRYRL